MEKDYQIVETLEVEAASEHSMRGHWNAYENIDMVGMAVEEFVFNWREKTTLEDLKRKVEDNNWSAISISNIPNFPPAML